MNKRNYLNLETFDPEEIKLTMVDRGNKGPYIGMYYGSDSVAFITPACITQWPRVSGDGNFGTMWGPTDVSKAKYTLDLCDAPITGDGNKGFESMAAKLEAIDDKLLDFVYNNQLKCLHGRKNLSKEECKMLQIRTVRAKYDRVSGAHTGNSVQLSTSKFTWDGMGGKYARKINVYDHKGNPIVNGNVAPGDAVAATMYLGQVYTGVGGDKFGIQWSFDDVSVVCQRARLECTNNVSHFASQQYDFAKDYEHQESTLSDPILVS